MAKCFVCNKGTTFGNLVSHSIRRVGRTWKPNLRRVKIDDNGTSKTVYVCSRCLRSNKIKRAI
ncbi:MAG: 50S ribosomal protein L28 [Eubacteriales bacterium]|nr:50S ribosomal protein L28 [Eubacteriales bacterium]